jgi:hypothetical protein
MGVSAYVVALKTLVRDMGCKRDHDASEGTRRVTFTVARATPTSSDYRLAVTNGETGAGCVFIIPPSRMVYGRLGGYGAPVAIKLS